MNSVEMTFAITVIPSSQVVSVGRPAEHPEIIGRPQIRPGAEPSVRARRDAPAQTAAWCVTTTSANRQGVRCPTDVRARRRREDWRPCWDAPITRICWRDGQLRHARVSDQIAGDARGLNAGDHVEKLGRELHKVSLGCSHLVLASRSIRTVLGDREVDRSSVLCTERLVKGDDLVEDRQELYGHHWRRESVELAEHRTPAERGAFSATLMRLPCRGSRSRVPRLPTSPPVPVLRVPASAEHDRQAVPGLQGHSPCQMRELWT
jgi:hypothetical protein